jgi:hypothetical protein
MQMRLTHFYTDNEASRAEEMIPSMSYATLLDNLQKLTDPSSLRKAPSACWWSRG